MNIRVVMYGFYLGGSLGVFAKLTLLDWKWWAIMLPTAILVELRAK